MASAVYRLRVQEEDFTHLVTDLLLYLKLQKYFRPKLDQKPCFITSEAIAQSKELLESFLYII